MQMCAVGISLCLAVPEHHGGVASAFQARVELEQMASLHNVGVPAIYRAVAGWLFILVEFENFGGTCIRSA